MCEMVLGVAAAFVAVAVFSLSSLECSATTCLVSSTYISLHYSLNSWVLTGEMSVFFFLCLFRKEVHLVSYCFIGDCVAIDGVQISATTLPPLFLSRQKSSRSNLFFLSLCP